MRVLVAFDKFKDAIHAHEACVITTRALQALHPDWIIESAPLTDGGDGFVRILTESTRAPGLRTSVTGPRHTPVEAAWALVPRAHIPVDARRRLSGNGGTVAVIEMAAASGLALVPPDQRDPWTATSAGTGELMRSAVEAGTSAILLGVGGSATHDLGLGALHALGFRFLDHNGQDLGPAQPADWANLARIEGGPPAGFPPVHIACDVDNPLLGSRGAATVFAPQKGLRAQDRERLEELSARVARQLCAHCGRPESLMNAPGTGAAGGISFGLMAALGARLLPGFDLVSDWLDLDRRIAAADLVITGEGRFDPSSLGGKGPGTLTARALAAGKIVHVFAGQVETKARTGLHLHAVTPANLPLAEALPQTSALLDAAVRATFI